MRKEGRHPTASRKLAVETITEERLGAALEHARPRPPAPAKMPTTAQIAHAAALAKIAADALLEVRGVLRKLGAASDEGDQLGVVLHEGRAADACAAAAGVRLYLEQIVEDATA